MFEPLNDQKNAQETSSASDGGIEIEGVKAVEQPQEINFDHLDFAQFGVEGEPSAQSTGEAVEGEIVGGDGPPGVLSRDQFFEAFRGCFNIGHQFTGLESLAVPANDNTARAACDAVYDIALEVEYLRFLIQPGNTWIQRSIAIGAFAVPKYLGVKAELEARRAVAEAKAEREAANDNGEAQADAG